MAEYRLPEGVRWREIEGEVVAVDLGHGRYIGINATGALLWPMLQNGASAEALLAALVDNYDVSADIARRDLSEWLEWLAQHELLG